MSKRAKNEQIDNVEETRQLILQAAQRLFFERGFRSVTTRQVADVCGLTQPALYHHFKDKKDLYVAVLVRELQHYKANFDRINRRNESFEEKMRLFALTLLGSKHDFTIMFHDIAQELDPPHQMQVGQAFQENMVNPIALLFDTGVQQGQLRKPAEGGLVPELATHFFLSTVSNFLGENRESFFQFVGRNENDIARLIVQVQLKGLAKPS